MLYDNCEALKHKVCRVSLLRFDEIESRTGAYTVVRFKLQMLPIDMLCGIANAIRGRVYHAW